jgi:hypothetical protein
VDVAIFLLIDGLGYLECADWPERPEPVFVDGPSTTEFGFGEVLRTSGLLDRVLTLVLSASALHYRLRAYCYWDRRNELTDQLFAGAAVEQVRNFQEALSAVTATELRGDIIFILREGLDELAHRRRELSPSERAATVAEIRGAFLLLCELVERRGLHGLVCLVADHGIWWREDGPLTVLDPALDSYSARFTRYPASQRHAVTIMVRETPHYLLRPGLLARPPRRNEAGFHGGLSAAESLVPLITCEIGR